MTRPILLRAFYSVSMWHIWDAFTEDSSSYYKVAKTQSEVFKLVYDEGYELKAIDSTKNQYFFQLRDDELLQDVNEYIEDAERYRAEQRALDE